MRSDDTLSQHFWVDDAWGKNMNDRKNIRVLVVEDNDDVRNIISVYLKSKGFTVLEAADGQTGLDMAISMSPTVVLLDVLIPKLDGIETLQGIRNSSTASDVPVVMMSAILQTRDIEAETRRLNVSSFLQKPFQVRQLIEHIDHALIGNREATASHRIPNALRHESDVQAITYNAESPLKPLKPARKVYCKQERIPQSGTLSAFPLPKIIHTAFMERKTGNIRIFSNGVEKRIYFQNGYPIYAESSLASETLGAYLVRNGKISETQHERIQKDIGSTGKRYGEVLLNERLVGPHVLFAALEAHLTEKIVSIFSWFEGQFIFEDGEAWKDDIVVVKMKPGRIILDGINANWTLDRLKAIRVLQSEKVPFFISDELYSADDLSLTTHEARIWQMLRQGLPVTKIVNKSNDSKRALQILFFCYLTGTIGFVLEGAHLSNADQGIRAESTLLHREKIAQQNAHARLDADAQAFLKEYMISRGANYFEILGVKFDSTADEINRAYMEQRGKYHPNKLSDIKDSLVHEKVEELNMLIHKAYSILINPKSREKYIQGIMNFERTTMLSPPVQSNPAKTQSFEDQHNLTNQKRFEKAFSFIRDGFFAEAANILAELVEKEDNARYHAYLIWSQYLSHRRRRLDTETQLKRIATSDLSNVDAMYLLGSLFLKEKNNKEAIIWFERVLKTDPQNIDATRQLRLIRMRANSEVSGLFDLLKMKKQE